MADRTLYRLNGVAHIAGSIGDEHTRCIYSVRRQQNMPMHERIIPYLERAGFHLARLNSQWFWLDEPLVSAFVERWRPETHTFHMPFGECTVTLHDVAFQLGLPVDGDAVSGCLGEFASAFCCWPMASKFKEERWGGYFCVAEPEPPWAERLPLGISSSLSPPISTGSSSESSSNSAFSTRSGPAWHSKLGTTGPTYA
nr:protein MAIN-LIKE 2-like [Arachis hypogaea]XP_025657603.1 protein MAIN-LIKE 2-like [Arachis hypogaea]